MQKKKVLNVGMMKPWYGMKNRWAGDSHTCTNRFETNERSRAEAQSTIKMTTTRQIGNLYIFFSHGSLYIYLSCAARLALWRLVACPSGARLLPNSRPSSTVNSIEHTQEWPTSKYEHCERVGAVMFRFPLTLRAYIIFIANVH